MSKISFEKLVWKKGVSNISYDTSTKPQEEAFLEVEHQPAERKFQTEVSEVWQTEHDTSVLKYQTEV